MTHPLLYDGTWAQQWKYESAEAFYQQVLAGTSGSQSQNQGTNITHGSNLKSEIAQARQNIHKALNELVCVDCVVQGTGDRSTGGAVDQQVINRIKTLETENNNLKKNSQDLTALVKKLEARVAALEIANKGTASSTPAASKPAEKEEDSDSDEDLFGDDDSSSEDEETKRRLAEYAAKKAKKTAVIAKSSLLLDVKPWDDETDMAELERNVRTIEMDGLVWGQGKLVPVGYGIRKLQINAIIEDAKVSTDDLEEKITGFEDFIQSMDIAAFNKI